MLHLFVDHSDFFPGRLAFNREVNEMAAKCRCKWTVKVILFNEDYFPLAPSNHSQMYPTIPPTLASQFYPTTSDDFTNLFKRCSTQRLVSFTQLEGAQRALYLDGDTLVLHDFEKAGMRPERGGGLSSPIMSNV